MERLFLTILIMMTGSSVMAQKPIIPMKYSSRYAPFLDDSLRDPGITKKKMIRDTFTFEETMEEIDLQREEVRYARGLRRLELLESLYLSYQNISYYLTDVKYGRIGSISDYKNIDLKIANARKLAIHFATNLAKYNKNNYKRARALYHIYTNRYLTTSIKTASVKSLLDIRRHLNGYLKRCVDFLNGYHNAEYKDEDKGLRIIKKTMGSLPTLAGITGRLVIAKKLAGIKRNGKRVKKVNQSYRKYLAASAYRTRKINKADKKRVFDFAVGVWRTAEGRNGSWAKAPFKLKHFSDIVEVNAIVERTAIEDMKAKNYKRAINKYYSLSKKLNGSYSELIDLRIIDLFESRYAHHKTGVAMQKVLAGYHGKYKNDRRSRVYRDVRKKHIQLIDQELEKAQKRSATKQVRTSAIGLAYKYLNGFATSLEEIRILGKVANTFILLDEPHKAVDVYLILKGKTSGQESLKYLNLAINSQRKAANWPIKAPWNGAPSGNREARAKLLAMMSAKYQITDSWDDLAHFGLINIDLGQRSDAFSPWLKKLEDESKSIHARKALGYIALTYKKDKIWEKLEDIARLGLKKALIPIYLNKNYSAHALLADALFFGGKKLFDEEKWADTATKLEEFTRVYTRDSRRPEGLYIYGKALYNKGSFTDAVNIMRTIAETYPSSPFEKQALLLGGEWSIPMALEEQTLFFYQRFANKYRSDKQTIEIRNILVDLYLGREIYGSAARVYLNQSRDLRLSDSERLKAALKVMDIEERHGEVKHANAGVKLVYALGSANADAMARVYGYQTRLAAANDDRPALRSIEEKLNRLPNDSQVVKENLAQVKFAITMIDSKRTKNEIFNLGLTEPLKALNEQHKIFIQVSEKFRDICNIGETSYCAPSMMLLSETTKNTFEAIENLTIPDTLDESAVNEFNNKKLEIMVFLDQVASDADARALGMAAHGETTPDWSREVTWSNDNESDIDQNSRNIGNGYIQWAPVTETKGDSFGTDLGEASWE